MPIVHLDFETRSQLSVKDVGGWCYSRHPSTSILCAAFAVDDEPVELFTFQQRNRLAGYLNKLAEDRESIFYAHNAFFEQCIWRNIMVPRYGFPEIPIERWRCTAAKAASMSLPRDLEGVGMALDLPIQKDKEGHRVMMKLSRPRPNRKRSQALLTNMVLALENHPFKVAVPPKNGEVTFWEYDDCPEDFEKLYRYCVTDVETERLVDKALPSLNAREQKVWFLDQKINFRGVRADVAAIQQTLKFIDTTVSELTTEFQQITDLDSPSQVAKFRTWLEDEGVELPNLQAATVDKVLDVQMSDGNARRALEIRRQLSKISTKKYEAMLSRADMEDGRIRDILLYYAALTGRWGGRGIQPQNLPRGTVDSDVAISFIQSDDYHWFTGAYPDPMSAYSSCVRGMLTASPGHELYVADFASIEARVLPWLAGQESALEVFRNQGDPYCEEATGIFGRPITKKDKYERSVGKVSVLALGYGGGIGAFGAMARAYSMDLRPAYSILWPSATTDEQEKARSAYEFYLKRQEREENPDPLDMASGYASDIIKQRWRKKNSDVVAFWAALENAAVQAVLTGRKQTVGGPMQYRENSIGIPLPPVDQPVITYGMMGEHLLCKLPSGNCLVYPFAKVSIQETDWGARKSALTYKTQNEKNYQYGRTFTYGGKLAENVTQAVARDLLADALLRLDAAGFDIVLHVHDEVVAESSEGAGRLVEYERVMSEVPTWAAGLPVAAEAWKGYRYRK
jgi:DNA polymerase